MPVNPWIDCDPPPGAFAVDELRDGMPVVAAVRAGERLTVTVDGEPVADVVPPRLIQREARGAI